MNIQFSNNFLKKSLTYISNISRISNTKIIALIIKKEFEDQILSHKESFKIKQVRVNVNSYRLNKFISYKSLIELKKPLMLSEIKVEIRFHGNQIEPPMLFSNSVIKFNNIKPIKINLLKNQTNAFYILNDLKIDIFNQRRKMVKNCSCSSTILFSNWNYAQFNSLTFICRWCGQEYLCSCFLKPIKTMLKYASNTKVLQPEFKTNGIKYLQLKVKKQICHICKNIPADFNSDGNRKTIFASHYEPYIQLETWNDEDFWNIRTGYQNYSSDEYVKKMSICQNNAENRIREKVGVPKIGMGWATEALLFRIVSSLFPNHSVLHQASPDWLGNQRFDIFVPESNLAIEYQGEQHFKSIKLFGGEQGLIETQRRDQLKMKKCIENNISLIYFTHKDKIDINLVKERLKNWLK